MKTWWIKKILMGIIFIPIALAIFGFIVMTLWNALIPEIFKGPELTFFQAAGLLILSHILLRGWTPWRHNNGWRHDRWKKRFDEKIASMTPEEREKFKEEWKHRCGCYPGESDEKKNEKYNS